MINKTDKIYIAGHNGMVGRACWRCFQENGYKNLIGQSSKQLDLRDQQAVSDYIKKEKPTVIVDAAARVGGIMANNNHPYTFLLDNMLIQNNLIKSAKDYNVSKFVFLGSSCIYPKFSPQPIKEQYLLDSPLETTNEWYAIAKISGVKLIESIRKQYDLDYISLMPTNLYGPNDNFDLETSHVLPAMIRKFHEAKIFSKKTVKLWGSGTIFREFLHVNDLASAVLFSVQKDVFEDYLYNVGSGFEISIRDLAQLVSEIVGFEGEIYWDESIPDGTPRKLLDSSKLNKKGWQAKITLIDGIQDTYTWFINNYKSIREVKFEN